MATEDAKGNLHDERGRFARKGGGSTPYIDLLKSQGYDTSGMSEEWAEEHCKFLGINKASGAVSGAVDPDSERGNAHAKRFYEEMRHRKDDIASISKNTGISAKTIEKIKNYVFIDKHDLEQGYSRFDPNCDMAISWQRLIAGKQIAPDIIMLKHEIMEMELVSKGMPQQEAHDLTNKTYNYTTAIIEWRKANGKNKKHN